MVSAVEQMAANTSWSALGKAKDLRNRILFTLGLLCVYRLGTFIPVPGIDGAALREFMEQAQTGIGGMLSMFTGGALGTNGHLCPWYNALYFCIDHCSVINFDGAIV